MQADRPSLTLSEARGARLVAEGRTDAEIAEQLAISVVDIDRELAEVLHKLDLRSRTELALLLLPPIGGQPSGEDSQLGDPLA